MTWNWQQPDWPHFAWQASRLIKAEERFLLGSGVYVGTVSHLEDADRERITVDVISSEALTTSEIEGEILDRASVQSSVRHHLGLAANKREGHPAEHGISEMMVNLFRTCEQPLDQSMLFRWHRDIMRGPRAIREIGSYRTHPEPMRVVSGRAERPTVHFEAPPSTAVPKEMERFIDWFNCTAPSGEHPLPALTRAGLSHIYFESIHPFEDGNGRIGRALAEKALAQSLRRPSLTALATTMLIHRRGYYSALAAANKGNEVTNWLTWFAATALEAQHRALAQVEFLIKKTRLLERVLNSLNDRQQRAIHRVLREGPDGFEGGLSARNYVTITGASTATASRDLADLVDKGVLTRTGERRHARYGLAIQVQSVPVFSISPEGEVVKHADAQSDPAGE